MKIPPCRCFF